MAHYAELDENNIVQQVVVMGDEDESIVEAQLNQQFNTVWKRTSYNTLANEHTFNSIPFRKNYAGIGYVYDEQRDAFIPPKLECHTTVTLNEDTCQWVCNDSSHAVTE